MLRNSFANKKKQFIAIAAVLLLLAVLFLLLTAVEIIRFGNKDEKTAADIAIILGAGTSDAGVSPVYRERIKHGIWLYENDYVDYLLFTGGLGEGNRHSDAFAAREYAISSSVPEEAIFIEESSTITEENLENAKRIMEAQSLDTAIIVSDPLHMKRAMRMAKDYGITAYSSPTPTSMYRSLKTKAGFLIREEFFYIGYSLVRLLR